MTTTRSLLGTILTAALLVLGAGNAALGANGSGGGGSRPGAEIPGEILVKLRATSALPGLLARFPSLLLVDQFGARPIYRLRLIGGARAKDVLGPLSLEPDVMIAEANLVHRAPEARRNVPWAIGKATDYVAQWGLDAMHLAQAQALATGAGVRVAVLDTGIDFAHPALAGRLLQGFDFVDFDNDPSEVGTAANLAFGHGTHVAGLVAMAAPGAQVMPLRVLDSDGGGNTWVLAEAMLYAVDPDGNPATDDGAQVVNLSLGSLQRTRIIDTIATLVGCGVSVPDDPVNDLTDPGYGDDAIRCAIAGRGVFVVAAAGNDASRDVKQYPAAESAYGLVSVAASSSNGRVASFSNFGSWIDVAAPGEGITSTLPGGIYGTWSGTSMAAPLVAGVAALLISANPGVVPTDVYKRIKRNAALMCQSQLRQVDALAAILDREPSALVCN